MFNCLWGMLVKDCHYNIKDERSSLALDER